MARAAERLRLPARIDSVKSFCGFVRRVASRAGFTAEDLDRLDLVIEEIVVNIARYAYGPQENGEAELVCALAGPRTLHVEISDAGRPFDPVAAKPPDLGRPLAERPHGGLGIFLVRNIAESIEYKRDGNRNILAFTLISAEAPATKPEPKSFLQ